MKQWFSILSPVDRSVVVRNFASDLFGLRWFELWPPTNSWKRWTLVFRKTVDECTRPFDTVLVVRLKTWYLCRKATKKCTATNDDRLPSADPTPTLIPSRRGRFYSDADTRVRVSIVREMVPSTYNRLLDIRNRPVVLHNVRPRVWSVENVEVGEHSDDTYPAFHALLSRPPNSENTHRAK